MTTKDTLDYKEAYETFFNDAAVGVRKMEELANCGSILALIFLGCIHRDGTNEIPKNLVKAEFFFNKAFFIDPTISGFYLGRLYFDIHEYQKAFEVLQISRIGCYSPVLSLLGHLYQNGIGADKNIDEAIKLYQEAIRSGNVWAKKRLGKIFLCGEKGFLNRLKGAVILLEALIDGFYIAYKFSLTDERLLS